MAPALLERVRLRRLNMTKPENREPSEGILPFEEVYQRYASPIYRYCLAQLREPALAEDLGAQIFLSAWGAYANPPPPDRVQPWLYRIARNAVIDERRRRGRWGRLLGMVAGNQPAPESVEGVADLREDVRQIVGSMSALKQRERELISLRVGAGLSYAEIGGMLKMSEASACVATRRAIAKIRAAMESSQVLMDGSGQRSVDQSVDESRP